jgi:hypothetical protein
LPAALSALLVVLAVLVPIAYGPDMRARLAERRTLRAKRRSRPAVGHDPGRERRAEQRARELLRSVVNEEEWAMYSELGFIRVLGVGRDGAPSPYAYLIYPHKPIVAYMVATGGLLNEYCVEFPDRESGPFGSRLPASDDVLAKWVALRTDEGALIRESNMHQPGRQVDPGHVRRDIRRLAQWERAREHQPVPA